MKLVNWEDLQIGQEFRLQPVGMTFVRTLNGFQLASLFSETIYQYLGSPQGRVWQIEGKPRNKDELLAQYLDDARMSDIVWYDADPHSSLRTLREIRMAQAAMLYASQRLRELSAEIERIKGQQK